ncbi:MAG: hypothetical protein M5R40_03270 [Anaerolineae bacterium]|nr:hypothetical protein [Anaerolineae bacterium]
MPRALIEPSAPIVATSKPRTSSMNFAVSPVVGATSAIATKARATGRAASISQRNLSSPP